MSTLLDHVSDQQGSIGTLTAITHQLLKAEDIAVGCVADLPKICVLLTCQRRPTTLLKCIPDPPHRLFPRWSDYYQHLPSALTSTAYHPALMSSAGL